MEWYLDSTGGSIIGTAYGYSCDSGQDWTVTGTLYSDGYMSLAADSPWPGGYEGCDVTSEIALSGYIENEGCDIIGPDLGYESDDYSSGYVNASKYSDIPGGESQTNVGWSVGDDATESQWRQTLTGGGGV